MYWERTSKGVLTLEYIDGIKVSDLPPLKVLDWTGTHCPSWAPTPSSKWCWFMVFFMAILIPGNVFILPENVICLLDYGMVGRLDKELKGYLIDLLLAIIKRDANEVIDVIIITGTSLTSSIFER